MTNEEKVRAYDEALNKLKPLYEQAKKDGNPIWSTYEYLVPELAESEDEKIRKEIIHILQVGGYMSPEEKGKALAYLEKQKEQKPTIELVFPKFRVGDIIRSVRDKWDKTTRRISHVGEHGYNFDYRHLGDKVSGGSFGFSFEDDYELVEQKPAEWSEEDEDMFVSVLHFLNTNRINERGKVITWVESLPKRFSLQPKPEWSEEDKRFVRDAIAAVEAFYSEGCGQEELVNWLKSLRPQPKAELTLLDENIIDAAIAFVEQNNHFSFWGGIDKHMVIKALRSLKSKWKPTDEQMEALKNSAYGSYQNGDGPILRELYEQLKKLM